MSLRRVVFASLFCAVAAFSQIKPNLYAGLRWRMIGPFRSGRISAVTGVSGQPGVYYVGLPGGGVWKTVSAGATWFPIFDSITSVSSIGAVEVAPSDPNIVYVGTGDLITGGAINEGNGMYKSTDAGKNWEHIGLDDSRQIPAILVDPHDPNVVLVAAQGNQHGDTTDGRGIFRTTDGGKTWKTVLVRDSTIGIQDIAWAYDNPSVILATTVRHYTPPPTANGAGRGPIGGGAAAAGRGGAADGSTAIFKSTDEGLTWTELTSPGLPQLSGRTGVAVAAHTNSRRMFLVGAFGLYRSDDGGATWSQATTDFRAAGSGYICDVYVDTKDPDTVYVMNTATYVSTDGGHNFSALKGAPGGDDNHVLWIDPADHQRLLMGTDQGATISFDQGHTWSQWWNLPNAQVYHIATDNRFPYWVYATQQDTGSIGSRSRGDFGEITPFDWWPTAGYEFGYVASDPLNNGNIYIGSAGGGISEITPATGMYGNIAPNQGPTDYRKVTNNPIVFSPTDPHIMYVGTQFVVMSADRGLHWKNISPDLTTRGGAGAAPAAAGGRGGSALETVAPSPAKAGVIWAGSNNGLVHVTVDNGATWSNVTPPDLPAYADLSMIEASHFDAATAYAAVDEHGAGDFAPFIYRTRDSGKTWQKIVEGLPADERSGSFVRVVREDPNRPGLLYAGTESSVYVSFDDGDHWQSLRLNLPTTSYRDIVVHGNDLVVGTYGRAFYVLDDISPLRQLAPTAVRQIESAPAYLFKPGDAIRVRWSVMANMPFTPEMPHADNPPFGAIIYYYLGSKPTGEVKLEIYDSANHLIRTLSSMPPPPVQIGPQAIPDYWMAHPEPLPTAVGTNRTNWDIRFEPPPALNHSYQATDAVFQHTPLSPEGPYVLPGQYMVKLIVDGRPAGAQTFTLHNDPRLGESPAVMQTLNTLMHLEQRTMDALHSADAGYRQAGALREQIRAVTGGELQPEVAQALTALDSKIAAVEGTAGGRRGGGGAAAARGRGGAATGGPPPFSTILGDFDGLLTALNAADMLPNEPQQKEFTAYCTDLNTTLAQWHSIVSQDLPALNTSLTGHGLKALSAPNPPASMVCQ